jgi:plastocyanin
VITMTATRALLVGTALIAVVAVFAACSGGGAAAWASPPPGVDVSIDAKDIAFSTSTLNVRAGQPFKLFFRNLDAAPHNVAIYRDDSASQPIFVGATITDAAVMYDVPSIPSGTGSSAVTSIPR